MNAAAKPRLSLLCRLDLLQNDRDGWTVAGIGTDVLPDDIAALVDEEKGGPGDPFRRMHNIPRRDQ